MSTPRLLLGYSYSLEHKLVCVHVASSKLAISLCMAPVRDGPLMCYMPPQIRMKHMRVHYCLGTDLGSYYDRDTLCSFDIS